MVEVGVGLCVCLCCVGWEMLWRSMWFACSCGSWWTISWDVFGLWVRNRSIWFVFYGSGVGIASGVLGFVVVSSFAVRVLLVFHFTLLFLAFSCKVAILGFLLFGKKRRRRFGYFLSREKRCGFFTFWWKECVLNCDLDVLCLVGEKMLERKRCLNFECWILLSLGPGKT